MRIKDADRVLYAHNPLVEVVAQIRFEQQASLITGLPAGLTEHLRVAGFVHMLQENSAAIQITFGEDSEKKPKLLQTPSNVPTIYHFESADKVRKLSVCADFVALTTSRYTEWKDFKKDFLECVATIARLFPQARAKRVGLRYKDLIEREKLGLRDVPWRELVSPLVAGVFAIDNLASDGWVEEAAVAQQASQVSLVLDDCQLLLQSALLRSVEDPKQQAVLIDSDFFREVSAEPINGDEIRALLDRLHSSAGSIFHHCIQRRLHDALGPQPAPNRA